MKSLTVKILEEATITLPENTEEKNISKLMARELSDNGDDDILASTWSDPVQVKVFMPENILPIAMAKLVFSLRAKEFLVIE